MNKKGIYGNHSLIGYKIIRWVLGIIIIGLILLGLIKFCEIVGLL